MVLLYVMKMVVTFCGHSQLNHREAVKTWLTHVTEHLILQGATTFYLGGYGEFDSLAASILQEHKKRHPQVELVLVLAYFPSTKDSLWYDATVYPPLETVPRRFVICYRNRWMVYGTYEMVSYVLHDWGGATSTLQYAKQKRKKIISFPTGEGR